MITKNEMRCLYYFQGLQFLKDSELETIIIRNSKILTFYDTFSRTNLKIYYVT